ncbi:colicin immunity domain-containing protein [Isosphaeraceae bacterium EP7]
MKPDLQTTNLLELAEIYVKGGELNSREFVDALTSRYVSREAIAFPGIFDGKQMEQLSSIFCDCEIYTPRDNREAYQIDEAELKRRIRDALNDVTIGRDTELI